MEFIYLIIIGLILGVLIAHGYENLPLRKIFKREALVICGYKLHHSLYGVILIIITFMSNIKPTTAVILISIGVGIIFQHYLTGGKFDLITKDKK